MNHLEHQRQDNGDGRPAASPPPGQQWSRGARLLFSAAGAACLSLILRQWQRGLRLDWDIDAFLMMAWRHSQGEWLFIDYYDPKWPHVPWAYLPGALSGSLLVHLLVSWLAILATALAITGFGRAVQRHPPAGLSTPLAAGVLYGLLAPLLPGGAIGHLEIYANALLAGGLWLVVASWQRASRWGPLLGGLAIGLGVGLRPNLLIPVLATSGAVLALVPGVWRHRRRLGAALAGVAIGVLGPFLPYLLPAGGWRAAWLGGVAVLRDWNRAMYPELSGWGFGQDLISLYNPKVFGVPGLVLAGAGAGLLLLGGLRQGPAGRKVLVLWGVWQAALWASYALSHIHHHYVLMDLAGLCAALAAHPAARLRGLPLVGLTGLLVAVLLYPLKPLSAQDQRRVRDEARLVSWLSRHSPGGFQSPEWIGPHWRLHNPQATKAVHPVWSLQILDSPLNQAASVAALGLQSSWPERCAEWLAAKPAVLVVSPGTAARCQLAQRQDLRNITNQVGLSAGGAFMVFSQPSRPSRSLPPAEPGGAADR
jgi:hypothetical protein